MTVLTRQILSGHLSCHSPLNIAGTQNPQTSEDLEEKVNEVAEKSPQQQLKVTQQ
jgi:hypothetical protein